MSNVEIGETLRESRDSVGLTQKELAEAADVHRTYVSLLERNQKSPTLEVLFRLCRALELRPSEFLEDVEGNFASGEAWWSG